MDGGSTPSDGPAPQVGTRVCCCALGRWRCAGAARPSRACALALDDYGDIDLPRAPGSADDQAQLRALATLYLASELEAAGLIPAVETLVRLARAAALPGDLGDAPPA